jgi:hypothetical protein
MFLCWCHIENLSLQRCHLFLQYSDFKSNIRETVHEHRCWTSCVWRLSTRKVTLSDVNAYFPGFDRLLKLWQETRDPTCKTAVNWVANSIRRLTRTKKEIANTEVTPRTMWPVAKSPMKRDGPKAPTAIRGSFGPTFHPLGKANAIANCLENQFTP